MKKYIISETTHKDGYIVRVERSLMPSLEAVEIGDTHRSDDIADMCFHYAACGSVMPIDALF